MISRQAEHAMYLVGTMILTAGFTIRMIFYDNTISGEFDSLIHLSPMWVAGAWLFVYAHSQRRKHASSR